MQSKSIKRTSHYILDNSAMEWKTELVYSSLQKLYLREPFKIIKSLKEFRRRKLVFIKETSKKGRDKERDIAFGQMVKNIQVNGKITENTVMVTGNLKTMILMLGSGKMEKLMDMEFIKKKMVKIMKESTLNSRSMEKVLKPFQMVIDMRVNT